MSALANTSGRSHARAVRHPLVDRRRIALATMLALACASSLVLLADVHVGPAWVHWLGSLVALAAGLGVVVVAERNWQRAISTAAADGLVARSTDEPRSRSDS
jgi:phosphatidylglycerophosphate synthase